jgi:hypothetical protein
MLSGLHHLTLAVTDLERSTSLQRYNRNILSYF